MLSKLADKSVPNREPHQMAQPVDWFWAGAFQEEGFDMDFEARLAKTNSYDSSAALGSKSDAELLERLPAGPIMGGMQWMAIPGTITGYTAHHRGGVADALYGFFAVCRG